MGPVTSIGVLILSLVWVITMILSFPGFVLGILVSPLSARMNFLVEFLYPTAAGRWFHLTICRLVQSKRKPKNNDRNYGFHSRAMETRIEVVPGRVYVHILPQLLDNLGYLVVCVPAHTISSDKDPSPPQTTVASNQTDMISITTDPPENEIVAFVVDCGDATAVTRQLSIIRRLHYNDATIQIQSILSTHKHHDHTAGNNGLSNHPDVGSTIRIICGGAVERVPGCNFPVADGDRIPLPKDGNNDMNQLVEVEVVATPAHTRGSITYILRGKTPDIPVLLFTGDTIFSGGGGVPFEADTDRRQEDMSNKTASSLVKVGAATYAVERCFGEILYRMWDSEFIHKEFGERILLMAGHEYTQELLLRQFQSKSENCRWRIFSPATFFELCSQYLVSTHRRNLPSSSGKLLKTPSCIGLELLINPHFRSLALRGEIVAHAVQYYHTYFSPEKVSLDKCKRVMDNARPSQASSARGMSDEKHWNLIHSDVAERPFTTVYSEDFNALICDLENGRTSPEVAAIRLKEMKEHLSSPLVTRRPIPDSIPTQKHVYRALTAFAVLGSQPSAMTVSDSRAMKLPAPILNDSDQILLSKRRLVKVLQWLGIIKQNVEGVQLKCMIDILWKEAINYETSAREDSTYLKTAYRETYSTIDFADVIHLGSLKWLIYGVPSTDRPPLPFEFCMPCVKAPPYPAKAHPASNSGFPIGTGELIRHNVYSCKLCKTLTGCQIHEEEHEIGNDVERVLCRVGSSHGEDSEEEPFVEMTNILNEA